MELHADYENLCEQYLLGELSEADQAQLEEAYFADDSLFERFLAVKDDLLDAYSRGDLTGPKLESFKKYYLASEARRQKVAETREFINAVSAQPSNVFTPLRASSELSKSARFSGLYWFTKNFSLHPLAMRVGLVTALLLVIAGSWVIVRQIQDRSARRAAEERARNAPKPPDENNVQANRPIGPAPTSGLTIGGQRGSSSPTPPSQIAAKPSAQTSSERVASITLLLISSRDPGSANSLILTPETRLARLSLVFSAATFDSFDVVVHTVDGQEIFRRGNLKASPNGNAKSVTITFASTLLSRQDYIATLSGRQRSGKLETIGDYYFRVDRK